MLKTLPEEPDGMSQICGYQIEYGRLADVFCGELKDPGLYFCWDHHRATVANYGAVRMAPGNVRGNSEWQREPRRRPIPRNSGEAAIYSPEYLRKREGNAQGAEGHQWWLYVDA
jgi:hypothetical protein